MARAVKEPPFQGRGAAWKLARTIKKQIASGEFAPGSRLPSYRELMKQYDLTSGTVSYAMSILAEQGHVTKRHGSGVFAQVPGAYPSNPQVGESAAGSLKTQTGLVALVVPEIKSGLYLSLQAGMESASQERAEQLITVTASPESGQQADILLQLVDRGVSGIALVPPYASIPAHQLRLFHKLGVPLVLLHRRVPEVPVPVIAIPFEKIGRLAGQAIAKQGHQRVAAILGFRSDASDFYLHGFHEGLKTAGVELNDDCVLRRQGDFKTSDGYRRHLDVLENDIEKLLSRSERPTAIFATFDRLGELAYLVATRMGMSIPRDLSIVCFGGKQRIGAILERLTTVAVDEYETGRTAYQMLTAMHEGTRRLVSDEVLEMTASLDTAETLGPPPTSNTSESSNGA